MDPLGGELVEKLMRERKVDGVFLDASVVARGAA